MVHLQPEGADLNRLPGKRRPPSLGLSPILFKEFTIAGRRGPTYVWRAVGLGIIGLTVGLAYWDAAGWGHPRSMDRAGRAILTSMSLISFGIVTLAMPAAMVRSLLEERDRGTLGLLLASPLRPWRVALGKTAAALGRTGAWTMGVVPFLFLLLSFRGIEPGVIPGVLAEVAAGGLLATGLTLMLLTFRTSGAVLLIRIYLLLVGYLIVLPIFWEVAARNMGGTIKEAWHCAPWVVWSPLFELVEQLEPGASPGWLHLLGPGASLGAGMAFCLASTAILTGRLARLGSLRHVAAPRSPKRRRPIEGLPVYWYETEIRPRAHRRGWAWVVAIFVSLTLILALVIALQERDKWGWLCFVLGMGLVILLLMESVVRGAWAGGDPRTELPLSTSPYPPRKIAAEKIGAVVRKSLPTMVMTIGVFALAVNSGADRSWQMSDLAIIGACLVLTVPGLGALGAMLGRLTGSATRGTAAGLGILVTVGIGMPMVAAWVGGREWEILVAATDPVFFVPWVLELGAPRSLGHGFVALLFQAMWVAAIAWLTVFLWDPLTRRHA